MLTKEELASSVLPEEEVASSTISHTPLGTNGRDLSRVVVLMPIGWVLGEIEGDNVYLDRHTGQPDGTVIELGKVERNHVRFFPRQSEIKS